MSSFSFDFFGDKDVNVTANLSAESSALLTDVCELEVRFDDALRNLSLGGSDIDRALNTASSEQQLLFSAEIYCKYISNLPATRTRLNIHEGIHVDYFKCDSHFQVDIDEKSDLIPGQYGGGHKVWECSKDLAMYLHETTTTRTTASATSSSITTGSGRVLELGCGAALPGIAALCLGKCSRGAVFCDLNRSVLLETTWPSICMNVHHHILAKGDDPAAVCGPIRCFSGDWLQVSEQLLAEADELRQDGAKFDLILAAEANYCAESSAKLLQTIRTHLAEDGEALVASKRYYFGSGLGGGSLLLQQQLRSMAVAEGTRRLSVQQVRSFEDGHSNVRDILRISWETPA